MSSSRNSSIRAPPSTPTITFTAPGNPTFNEIRLVMSPTTVRFSSSKPNCPRKPGKSKC